MTRKALLFLFAAWAANSHADLFGPSNYWECILEEIPGVANDPAASFVINKCVEEFPDTEEDYEKKKPLWGVKTAPECVIEYGKDTISPVGVKIILGACYRLYPKE